MSNWNYAVGDNKEERPPAKLLYVTSAKYEGDWHSTPHTHGFTEFFYVMSGEGQFLIEDKTFAVRENDLVIINPSVLHTEMSLANSPLEYVVLGIDGVAFNFNEADNMAGYSLLRFPDRREEWGFYLRLLLREVQETPPHHTAVCQDLLDIMIIHLLRRTNFALSVESSRKANLSCSLAKRYIDEHFREPVTLTELAEAAHINKYYLAHIFNESYGVSPIQYMINRRIDECRNLLKTTDYSVAQIALFTGFSSQSYFAQCFRKLTGMRPGEYRRQESESALRKEETGYEGHLRDAASSLAGTGTL